MSPERWQQIERLYHTALEKQPADRAAFLDQACAGDEGLRREIESLLSYVGQAEKFIESPALEVTAKALAAQHNPTVRTGETLNQYRLTSRLGVGGMGEVYLAEDTRLGREVALKFLPAVFTQHTLHLSRFEQEARAVAALSHPNVCTIHEVIETAEGSHCIVMEYVHGATLRDRLAAGPMDSSAAIEIAIQVASALAAAHAAGVVHRDIKPENIMIRNDGYVKVLDFGLAKVTQPQPDSEAATKIQNTSPGIVMGTVSYMSPEQARGLAVDARTDIWSLGVLLYELLSGQRPFNGDTPTDVIVSILEREPAPVLTSAAQTPNELTRIIGKALAKNRDERYQTADDLLIDLKSLKRELDIGGVKPPIRKTSTTRLFDLRNWRTWLIGATAAILLVTGVVAARLIKRNSAPPATAIKSLAVLPLENASGDTTQDYFADGITDALISNLSKTPDLRVTSRPAVLIYKRAGKSPVEIGRELRADAVMTGTVVRTGDRVRVSVHLLRVQTGQDLWTQEFDRELRAVPALQAELTRMVTEKIGLSPPPQLAATRAAPISAEAYDQYLRGQFYLNRQTKEDNEAAIAALEKAVAIDPNFAAAHAELAQAYVWKLFLFAPREKHLEEKAFVSVEKALALDPDAAVAYLARGRLLWTPANHFPHDRAIKEYRHALALDPSLDEAHNQLALIYSHIGALPEALLESQFALAADPTNHLAQYRTGEALSWQGKYEEALSTLRAIPKDANPELVGYQIAYSLFNLGKKDEATAVLEQLLKDYPEDNRGLLRSVQAILAASAGQESVAESKIQSAIEKGKGFGHFHHTAYNIACAYALLRKPEQAVKWLETAAGDGFPCYPLFANDSNLNNIRQDPGFVDFLTRSKQKWESYKSLL